MLEKMKLKQRTKKGITMPPKKAKTKVVAEQPEVTDKEVSEAIAKMTDKQKSAAIANFAILPSVNAAEVINKYAKIFIGEQDLAALIDQLQTIFSQVKNGDLQHCEAMLVGQAHALQSIFMNLSLRAVNQEGLAQFETFLRLALRAQNQCRATLETLAATKNPPMIFAKQANINQGNGNQQVINGTSATDTLTCTRAHADQTINQQNELLEVQHGSETVDTRTTGKAIRNNPAMATLD